MFMPKHCIGHERLDILKMFIITEDEDAYGMQSVIIKLDINS